MAKANRVHSTQPIIASALSKAIAEHKAAARLARNRERDVQRLYEAHPDLADDHRPPFKGEEAEVWRAFNRRLKSTGITEAINRRYHAIMAEKGAFKRFVKTTPRNRTEVARYSRYLVLVIENHVGGSFNPHVGRDEVMRRGGLDASDAREVQAFLLLNQAVRALARPAH
jgi:hypothetical protein